MSYNKKNSRNSFQILILPFLVTW